MSIEALRSRLPDYAKDIRLNLGNVTGSTALNQRQVWGAMLASACATGCCAVIEGVSADALERLTPEEAQAAKAAAAVMAMNNVYYRAVHLMEDEEFGRMPARLRMNVIGNPGVDKGDFELWSLAVSAVNGCGMCLKAHAHEVAKRGITREAVQDALRIAAVVNAAAAVIRAEEAMPGEAKAAA